MTSLCSTNEFFQGCPTGSLEGLEGSFESLCFVHLPCALPSSHPVNHVWPPVIHEMDPEDEFLMQWLEMRQRLVVYLICLVVQYCVVQMYSFDIELRMAPRRVPGANTTTIDRCLTWTTKMDDALIDAFMHELEIGNKVKKTFTCTAYDNISHYLSTVFGFKVDKEKVKNRWKTLKKSFSEMYDIFESGTSGFSWNSSTKRWEAEDQVWNHLIEVKPKAALWRNMSLPNYEKMLALYGNDRAYGDDGETPPNMKKRQRSNLQELADTVNVVDQLASQNEVTFENFAVNLENFPHDDHSLGENSESCKRAKNSAATKELSQLYQIAEKMDVIAAVLREGNQVFRERYAPQISGEETLRLIRGCGCDERKIPDIYCFLMNDATKLRTVIQCPPLLRKQVIMKMVFGS